MWSWAAVALTGSALGCLSAQYAAAYVARIAAGDPPDLTTFYKALRLPAPSLGLTTWLLIAVQLACSLWFYRQAGWTPLFFAFSGATAVLLALAYIDARTRLLPNTLTYPFLLFGLLLAWADLNVGLWSALSGAACGYAFLWLVSRAYQRCTRQSGLGGGDLKLVAGLGAWLGWSGLWQVLLMACLMGLGFAMWQQRSLFPRGQYAFGPFLAMAGIARLLLAA